MDARILREAMLNHISLERAQSEVAAANEALVLAGCTSQNRAAMFLAQLGHESASLRYATEIASGKAYEGRRDLGNTQPGDGVRFRGRSYIQVTGRSNFGQVSRWAYSKRLVSTPDHFVRHPEQLSDTRWAWLAPVWYWTVARPQINSLCDKGDLIGVTRAINGGTNGLADRRARWNRCLALGDAILPEHRAVTGSGSAAKVPAKPVPAGPPPEGETLFVKTPMPPTDDDGNITTPKRTWPTVRVPVAFEPGTGFLKVDHQGRGGWIHLGRWWVRRRDWTPNTPFHDPQDHPVGPNGSERFVGYGWRTAEPQGADMIEIVLSAPDGAVVQWWRTR